MNTDKRITLQQRKAIKTVRKSARLAQSPLYGADVSKVTRSIKRYR